MSQWGLAIAGTDDTSGRTGENIFRQGLQVRSFNLRFAPGFEGIENRLCQERGIQALSGQLQSQPAQNWQNMGCRSRESMVCHRPSQAVNGFNRVKAAHLRRIRIMARNKLTGMANRGRVPTEEIGIQRHNHTGFRKGKMGPACLAQCQVNPLSGIIRIDRLVFTPFRLGKGRQSFLLQPRLAGGGGGFNQKCQATPLEAPDFCQMGSGKGAELIPCPVECLTVCGFHGKP